MNELMTLKDFIEKMEANHIELGFIKVLCSNDDCDGYWGITPKYINGEIYVETDKQYCRKCAVREKDNQSK